MNNEIGVDGSEDPGKKQAPRQVMQIPPRDSISALQVSTVLNALGLASSMLRSLSELEDDDSGRPTRQAMGGECKLALESSVINACSRLDALLGDGNRWKLKEQDTLEGAQRKVLKEQLNFSRAQTALSESIRAPHYERRPQMAQSGNLWLAIEGNPANLMNCIVGVGHSPQEALDAFDHYFKTGTHTEITAEFMANYAAEHDRLNTPPPQVRAEPTRPFEESDATTPLPAPKPKNPNRPKRK